MDDQLPYEQDLNRGWTHLPLPDEDSCWKDMARRLDEDEDRKPLIVWWKRGCMPWALALLLLLLAGGWWLKKQQRFAEPTPSHSQQHSVDKNNNSHPHSKAEKNRIPSALQPSLPQQASNENVKQAEALRKNLLQEPDKNNIRPGIRKPTKPHQTNAKAETKSVIRRSLTKNYRIQYSARIPSAPASQTMASLQTDSKSSTDLAAENRKDTANSAVPLKHHDTVTSSQPLSPVADSSNKREEKKEKPKASYFFSRGIALHQQLPLNGQGWIPYSSQGRKGGLEDYIPSVYARFNRKDRWFIQAEFRYGAPQSVKQVLYGQTTFTDTINRVSVTNSFTIQKTFYHQLPLSFHYNITKNLTLGTGMVWNRFKTALAEQTITEKNLNTQQEKLLSKEIVVDSAARSGSGNSRFTRNYWQALVETEYRLNKWVLGARYQLGLQPYLRFSLPGGQESRQRHGSLQVFIRYQFWQTKKKPASP